MARRALTGADTRSGGGRRRTALAAALFALVLVTGGAALANGGTRGAGYGYGYGYGYGEAPIVTTYAASSVTSTSATLNATVNPEGETVTACYFEYGRTERLGQRVPCKPFFDSGEGPVDVSAAIGGLEPDTTYHFVIVATNIDGTSHGSERTFNTLSSPPAVTSVSPDAGLEFGWTVVTIRGTGFAEASAVKFGSNGAVYFEVDSPTSITALSPLGTGTVQVTVANPGGTSPTTVADEFSYVPAGHGPAITKISPDKGPAAGGTAVSIAGTSFVGVTAVKFASTDATSFTVNSATSITAVSPAEAPGKVEVTVATPNGTSAISRKDDFRFQKPKK
ncbi:MAG TPA: IPT/TIG domain-containing protein [Solirubrobacteraceae bacterium]|nr:IPT/TIG domain-containing protein [Solirubrobacteraceae bacterium]